jgi:hypothetical protein
MSFLNSARKCDQIHNKEKYEAAAKRELLVQQTGLWILGDNDAAFWKEKHFKRASLFWFDLELSAQCLFN